MIKDGGHQVIIMKVIIMRANIKRFDLLACLYYTPSYSCFFLFFLGGGGGGFFTSQSTAMVMLGWSVHLATLFSWASLTK